MGKNVEHQLVLCHLPKTGGKTFLSILRKQQFGHEPDVIRLNDAGYLSYQCQERLQKADVICGHWNFDAVIPFIRKKRILFTWMRDPVERNYSLFNYWTRLLRSSLDIAKTVRKERWSLDDFFFKVDADKDAWVFASLAFLGMKGGTRKTIPEIVKNAKVNLRKFDFVGITEDFDSELKHIEKIFGLDMTYKRKLNKTPVWARTKMTQNQREAFRKVLEPEYEIYEYAKELGYANRG